MRTFSSDNLLVYTLQCDPTMDYTKATVHNLNLSGPLRSLFVWRYSFQIVSKLRQTTVRVADLFIQCISPSQRFSHKFTGRRRAKGNDNVPEQRNKPLPQRTLPICYLSRILHLPRHLFPLNKEGNMETVRRNCQQKPEAQ